MAQPPSSSISIAASRLADIRRVRHERPSIEGRSAPKRGFDPDAILAVLIQIYGTVVACKLENGRLVTRWALMKVRAVERTAIIRVVPLIVSIEVANSGRAVGLRRLDSGTSWRRRHCGYSDSSVDRAQAHLQQPGSAICTRALRCAAPHALCHTTVREDIVRWDRRARQRRCRARLQHHTLAACPVRSHT